MTHRPHRQPPSAPARSQRGVVLLFSMIALVILLIAAVALMRSFNTSLFTAGNIAFKRDLQNQGERAVGKVLADFRTTGPLALPAARATDLPARNYSASILKVNPQGIPEALLKKDFDASEGVATNDITPLNEPALAGQGVTIRYIVDRMCATAGDELTLGAGGCVLADNPEPFGNSATNLQGPGKTLGAGLIGASPTGVVYRLSVRVTGPRNTQAFFQSTFTVPTST